MQNICKINGKAYYFNDISLLSQEGYTSKALSEMPLKLYKYFPNTVSYDAKKNHSIEALENNTVYLQSPINFDDPYDSSITFDLNEFSYRLILYYSNLSGFTLQPDWDYSKAIYEFALFLHHQMLGGKQLRSLLKMQEKADEKLSILHENFALWIESALIKYHDSEDAWQRAFSEAIKGEFDHVQEFLVNKFRISCFTTSPYSMLMWSHYANSHKGFCIEYDIPPNFNLSHIFSSLFPVIYTEKRTSVLEECLEFVTVPRISPNTLWHIYMHGLLSKSFDWCYQNEWRLISYDSLLADAGNYNCKFFPISRVFLGNKMPLAERLQIIEICKRKDIPFTGIIIANDRYEMRDCPYICDKAK